jgi:hypothetical protein
VSVQTAVKAVMKHVAPLQGTSVDDSSYVVPRLCKIPWFRCQYLTRSIILDLLWRWIAGGVLEAILVHGIQPGASAAEAIPLKSILLMTWASHATPVAVKRASDRDVAQLASIVTSVVSAAHVMVTACSC